MSQRDYNQIYTVWRFVLQITQDGQHDGLIVDLLPRFTLAINNGKLHVGVGLDWICGGINLGFMDRHFVEQQRQRRLRVRDEAQKMGVTPKQYALRWGW